MKFPVPFNWRLGLFCLLLVSCTNTADTPETALDCGREFIDAVFKGNFKKARQLMLQDEANEKLLDDSLAKNFRARSSMDKERLRSVSIHINSVENLNDSVTIINFQNSYDSSNTVLKVIKDHGQWVTDLKYSFSGNF